MLQIESIQINNLSFCLKNLEKHTKMNPRQTKKMEVIKMRAEINETANRKSIEKDQQN